MKKTPFTLKSGNTTSFKDMGSALKYSAYVGGSEVPEYSPHAGALNDVIGDYATSNVPGEIDYSITKPDIQIGEKEPLTDEEKAKRDEKRNKRDEAQLKKAEDTLAKEGGSKFSRWNANRVKKRNERQLEKRKK